MTEEINEWLTESYDYERPRRGQIQGVILKAEEQGIIVDVGLKREGFVPYTDVDTALETPLAVLEQADKQILVGATTR